MWGGARGRDIFRSMLPRRRLAHRWPPSSACRPAPNFSPSNASPRTALVLSGGGAKGLAHIGAFACWTVWAFARTWWSGPVWARSSAHCTPAATPAGSWTRSRGRPAGCALPHLPAARSALPWHPAAARRLGTGRARLHRPERLGRRSGGERAGERRRCSAGNLLARGDFDSLPIPFRAVATDLAHREVVVDAVPATWPRPSARAPQCPCSSRPSGGMGSVPHRRRSRPPTSRSPPRARLAPSELSCPMRPSIRPTSLDVPLIVADRLVEFLFEQPRIRSARVIC